MSNEGSVFRVKNVLLIFLIAAGYLVISDLLIGFKTQQVFLAGFFLLFYFLSPQTRKWILAFSIFIVYWIIFDYMKAFPNYHYQPVHIESLYNAEIKCFGLHFDGKWITPNEYWLRHGNHFLDMMAGLFYLTWVPVPLLFAVYLFFKDRRQFFYFSLSFLLVNLIGFIIYYAYPAAPPWYVRQHGFDFFPATTGSTAGLSKFDHYFKMGIFKSIYSQSSNVFAAMPSLHSAYPVIVLYFGLKNKLGLINVLFALIMVGIWFSAVYTGHHYILDVLAGIACALLGIFLFNYVLLRNEGIQRLIGKMISATT